MSTALRISGLTILVLSTLAIGPGCRRGSATVVRRDMAGGTLALHGRYETAQKYAQRMMQEHCQGQYTILGEERVIVGSQTNVHANTNYNDQYGYQGAQGRESTHAAATTSDMTELQVTYHCGHVAPQQVVVLEQPAPGPAPAPAATPTAAPTANTQVFVQ